MPEPELFCRALGVVFITEVAGVLILIAATVGQWDDVIHYGSGDIPTFSLAVLA